MAMCSQLSLWEKGFFPLGLWTTLFGGCSAIRNGFFFLMEKQVFRLVILIYELNI